MKTNSVLLFILILMCIGNVGCQDTSKSEESSVCGVADPINELLWLNEQFKAIENIPESGIILYTYHDKEIIEIQSSLMSSTNLSQYYCDGTKLKFDTPETYIDYQDFLSRRVKIKILFGADLWEL